MIFGKNYENIDDIPATCTNIIVIGQLSKKYYSMVQNGEAEIEVPHGVTMRNKKGSRVLFFECSDKEMTRELTDGLDISGIPWEIDEAI